jgi:VWFA-related protein
MRAFFVCCFVCVTFGQQPPEAVFKSTTKLVQVSVIAQDKLGKPVTDLRREEFQIFDNGSPQEIRLFLAETEKAETGKLNNAPDAKAPNTLTNRIAPPAGSHSGYSVILIDNFFADFGDPTTQEEGAGLARVQTLKMLRSMPPGEKIAIYATGRTLQVICEFSSDRDLLERQLGKWRPRPDTPVTATAAMKEALASPPGTRPDLYTAALQKQIEGIGQVDAAQRAVANDDEMGSVADHLAGIPGRKNMIWISNRFFIGRRAIQKFNRAGVSIYPVDVDGVCRLCSPRPIATMNAIAGATGGLAYYQRNDLDIAMREAIDDGRVSYTLGFYQPGDDKQAAMHQLSVRVSRKDVALRYRTGYESEPLHPASAASAADLVQAMNRPVDATAIGMTVSATRARDRLNLTATFDLASLDLEQDQGLWKGNAEVVARFMAADGTQAGDVFSQTIVLNLRPETYASTLASGLLYPRELTIPAKAVELKLLIGNLASGKIGTLTVPLAGIKEGSANAR